jgi:hypothetical protein
MTEENKPQNTSQDILRDVRVEGNLTVGNITQQIYAQEKPLRPRNEQLLLKQVKEEVNSRLAQSLHNAVLINLGKQVQPDQVKRPWDAEIKIGSKPAAPLPAETKILEVFERPDIARKLLILGEPGAGKTTTMLDLAQALIQKAEAEVIEPIPVLFNLSSWKDPNVKMQDWLIEELRSKYGVRKDIGKQWLEEKQLLPLLDGLDEVKPEHQESCVEAINQWLEDETRPMDLLVCSRREEYASYDINLQLNGAILLQSLTTEQLEQYLSAINQSDLWQVLEQDAALLELVKTPLLLSITVLSYEELSLVQWQQPTSTQKRLELLLDAYVQKMMHREITSTTYVKHQPPTTKRTRRWLVFLAKQLQAESQTEFLIEGIQFDWISDTTKERVKALQFILFTPIVIGFIWFYFRNESVQFHPLSSTEEQMEAIVLFSSLSIMIFHGIFDFSAKAHPIRELYWSWRKGFRIFMKSLFYGTLFGILMGMVAGSAGYLELKGIDGASLGFLFGCLLSIIAKSLFAGYREFFEFLEIFCFHLLQVIISSLLKKFNIRIAFMLNSFKIIRRAVKTSFRFFIRLSVNITPTILFPGFIFSLASSWGSSQGMGFWILLREGILNGLLLGSVTGLILTSMTSWEEGEEIKAVYPNKGIRTTLQYFLKLELIYKVILKQLTV